ncbi:MAG: KEOPS complex subunit Cgi121 [Methanomicrobiales archaeon]
MTGEKETAGFGDANNECKDPTIGGSFTHQDNSYDIRAATCTIEDRTAFLQTLRTIAELNDTHIICFNADMLAGMKHAHTAMCHSVRSYKKGTMVSNTLEMEALLYAAGSRQCSLAAPFGIHSGENHLYVCCFPSSEKIWGALSPLIHLVGDSWSGINSQKKAYLIDLFGITRDELDTTNGDRIIDLVLERISLLEIYR